jgi:hypothetical protein
MAHVQRGIPVCRDQRIQLTEEDAMPKSALKKTHSNPDPGLRPSLMMAIFDEPIVIQRWAVHATESITAAAMISYALVVSQTLQNKNEGWFALTIKQWQEVVGLSRSEQETARAQLLELGLLKERRVGMPARLEYRVDEERVYAVISEEATRSFGCLDERTHSEAAATPGKNGKRTSSAFPPGYQPL